MNRKKLIPALVVGFVVIFVLGFLWHSVIMTGFYEEHYGDVARARADTKIPFIVLGYLVLALLMAYLYPIGYKGGSPAAEGMRFGILIGLLWVLPHGLISHATENITLTGIIVDAIWHVVEEGAGGIAVAMVYGAPVAEAAEEKAEEPEAKPEEESEAKPEQESEEASQES